MVEAILMSILLSITDLSTFLLASPVTLITALFPDLTTAINQCIDYMTTIVQFVPLALDFLMVPRQAVVFLFDYYVIKYSIYLITRAVKLILAVYNKLKP